jgi:hypothetical protein
VEDLFEQLKQMLEKSSSPPIDYQTKIVILKERYQSPLVNAYILESFTGISKNEMDLILSHLYNLIYEKELGITTKCRKCLKDVTIREKNLNQYVRGLKNHVFFHLNLLNFICPVCGFKSWCPNSVSKHMYAKHKDSKKCIFDIRSVEDNLNIFLMTKECFIG